MTDTMNTTATVPAQGWEMHYEAGTSDKFYRVMFVQVGTRAAVLVNYGRRGSAGQFKVHTFGQINAALRKAQSLTDEKVEKGYMVTRDFTEFAIAREGADALLDSLSPYHTAAKSQTARAFVEAAL